MARTRLAPIESDAAVTKPAGLALPDASRRNVLRVLELIRSAVDGQKVVQGWLRENYVGQDRQAMRLLRFLAIIDGHGRIDPEVLASRANHAAFREMLLRRLRAGLSQAGIELELDWERKQDWKRVRGLATATQVIQTLDSNVRNNVLGCFRALHEVISHMTDDEWLKRELESIDAHSRRWLRRDAPKATSEDRSATSSHPERPQVPDDALRIPYFAANDAVVFARVVFDGPLTPEFVRSVGLQLQQMATLMDGRAASAGEKNETAEPSRS